MSEYLYCVRLAYYRTRRGYLCGGANYAIRVKRQGKVSEVLYTAACSSYLTPAQREERAIRIARKRGLLSADRPFLRRHDKVKQAVIV